jgi:hypothetical protein
MHRTNPAMNEFGTPHYVVDLSRKTLQGTLTARCSGFGPQCLNHFQILISLNEYLLVKLLDIRKVNFEWKF